MRLPPPVCLGYQAASPAIVVAQQLPTGFQVPIYPSFMEWTLGSDGEARTPAGGYVPSGVQHALYPGKVDASGEGRPLAPCGADVRPWVDTSWSARTAHLPICDECTRITAKYPDPSDA
jgi:hypothetical protein